MALRVAGISTVLPPEGMARPEAARSRGERAPWGSWARGSWEAGSTARSESSKRAMMKALNVGEEVEGWMSFYLRVTGFRTQGRIEVVKKKGGGGKLTDKESRWQRREFSRVYIQAISDTGLKTNEIGILPLRLRGIHSPGIIIPRNYRHHLARYRGWTISRNETGLYRVPASLWLTHCLAMYPIHGTLSFPWPN